MLHLPEDGGAAGGAHEISISTLLSHLTPRIFDSESTCSILEWRSSNLVATTNGRLVLAYLHRVAASGKLAPETLPEQALISYPGERNGSPGHLRREDSLTACFFLSHSFLACVVNPGPSMQLSLAGGPSIHRFLSKRASNSLGPHPSVSTHD